MNPSEIAQSALSPATRFLSRFVRATEAFAAVETALLAPAMLALYFGAMELSDSFMASGKVTAAASSAADLVAQDNSVCDSEMTEVFSAMGAIMFPYSANNLQVRISSLIDAGNGTVKVAWSDGYNMGALAVNSTVAIPAGLVPSGSGQSVVFAEVTYNYSSPAGHMLYGSRQFSDHFYLHPRKTTQISRMHGC